MYFIHRVHDAALLLCLSRYRLSGHQVSSFGGRFSDAKVFNSAAKIQVRLQMGYLQNSPRIPTVILERAA